MVSLTLCPACEKPVLVPESTPAAAEVQCPLCDAEFTLADSIPDDAPALTVIRAPADAASDTAMDSAVAGEIESPEEEQVGADAFRFSFDDTSSDGDELVLSPMETATADEKESGAETSDEASADEDEHHFATVELGGDRDTDAATATADRKKPVQGIGWKGQLIGIVLFGIVGLGLGYGILKLVKPAAAEPIDQILASAWTSVSSLWGAEGTQVADEEAADTAGDDDFPEPGEYVQNRHAQSNDGENRNKKEGSPADQANAGTGLADAGGDGLHITLKANESIVIGPDGTVATAHPYAALLETIPQQLATLGQPTADQVVAAVADAQHAVEEADGQVRPAAYFGLCELGDKLALANPDDSDVQAHREAGIDLVRQLGSPENRKSLSAFSYQWLFLDSSKSPLDQRVGVFLVGQVQRVVRHGPLFASSIKIAKGTDTKSVVVITPKRPKFHVHDTAAVLGSVIRDPSGALPEFGTLDELPESDRSLVILSGTAVRLPDDS